MKELLEKTDFFLNPMALVSANGAIQSSNAAFAEQFGLKSRAAAQKQLQSLAALSATAIEEYLRACVRSEKSLEHAFVFRGRAREIPFRARAVAYPPSAAFAARSVLVSLEAIREHQCEGRGRWSPSVVSSETDRRHRRSEIEESLRRQSQILEVTLASIGDAVVVTDAQGRVTFLNGVAELLTGWSCVEAKDAPLTDVFRILSERTRKPVDDPVAKVLATGAVVGLANHTILVAKDGREIPIDDSAAPIRLPSGQLFGVVLIFRDITDQRRAEHVRAWLAAIVESSNDAIVSKTLNGVITSWNPAATRLFGYRADEAVGQSIMLIVPPDRHAEEREVLARLNKGERIEHFDTVRVAKDGGRVDVSLTVSPIRDEEGAIVGASKIARDIGERKRMESQLQEAERRKDQFLATLGHELRSSLAPVQNAVDVLNRSSRGNSVVQRGCDILRRQVHILRNLVDDLLDMSRVRTGRLSLKLEPLEFNEVLMNVVDSLRSEFETKQQTLDVSLPQGRSQIVGDRTRLAQVFSNLLQNANKYTQSKGRIEVVAHREGDHVVAQIKDDGIGIEPTMLARVFDLFFQAQRTHDHPAGGLGIGLSLAKTLVEMHGGTIEARSAGKGLGSEFVVKLPLAHQVEPT